MRLGSRGSLKKGFSFSKDGLYLSGLEGLDNLRRDIHLKHVRTTQSGFQFQPLNCRIFWVIIEVLV